MALVFPANPVDEQSFTSGDLQFAYNADKERWESTSFAEYTGDLPQAVRDAIELQIDPPAPPLRSYERNSEFIDLPTVLNTEQKMVALAAVYEAADNNWYSLRIDGGDYTVDWGDGTVENITQGSVGVHQYAYNDISAATTTTEGYRQAIITVTPQASQTITGAVIAVDIDSTVLLVGGIYPYEMGFLDIVMSFPEATAISAGGENSSYAVAAEKIEILSSKVTDLDDVLQGPTRNERFHTKMKKFVFNSSEQISACTRAFQRLFSLIDLELNADFSAITDASSMFASCYSLQVAPTIQLDSVVDIDYMFDQCYNLIDLSNLTFSSPITDAFRTFYLCRSLLTLPNGLDLSPVTSATNLFESCNSLVRFPSDIVWPTALQNATNMFSNCFKIAELPYMDLSSCTNLSYFAANCKNIKTIPDYDTSSCQFFSNMFSGCTKLLSVALDLSSATTTNFMFFGCENLDNFTILGQSSLCSSFVSMFSSCASLRKAPDLDFSSATDISSIYDNCRSLSVIPPMNLPVCTDAERAFYACSALPSIEMNFSNVAKVSSFLRNTFGFCYGLTEIKGNLDTTGATNFSSMCYQCESLESIPDLDFSSATTLSDAFFAARNISEVNFTPPTGACNYHSMFQSCGSLKSIPTLDLTNATDTTFMFVGCNSFVDPTKITNIATSIAITGSMSKDSIVTIFNNLLPAVGQTLLLSSGSSPSPNSALLTAQEIEIATNKGWTVVL